MRYTEQPDQDVRAIPAGEVWVGIIDAPIPYIGIATRLDDDERVMVVRLGAVDALALARVLSRLELALAAPNN